MRPGVSFPSYTRTATWAMITGAAHASYPVTNLAGLTKIRTLFRASAAGAIAFSGVLAASQPVQCVALCHHNAEAGQTYRIRLYADAGLTTLVADSGTLTFGVLSEGLYPQVTPYVLPSALTVRAVRVDLSAQVAAWQIGGAEVAGFWDLTHHDARSLGLKAKDQLTPVGRGIDHAMRLFSPRLASIGSSLIDAPTDGVTLSDFVVEKGTDLPFVWVRDADSDVWGREAILVRLSGHGLKKNFNTLGEISLAMLEHLR